MKKIIYLIVLLILPTVVLAAGSVTVSKSSMSLKPGGKASFNIKANSAAGRVNISSSDTSVVAVSPSSVWVDNDTKTITVTGKKDGTAVITVKLADVASYDGKVLNNSYRINVTVKTPEKDTRSTNNNLSSISVDGYELEKKSNTDYALTVKNTVTSINIKATAEDSKAKVSGIGNKNLKVGSNTFNVVVTAENGSSKTYILVVTRKNDNYTLEDIDDALNNSNPKIILNDGDIITKDILEKIKNKVVEFNKFQGNVIQYSWIVDGQKLSDPLDINTTVNFEFDDKSTFDEKVGYRSGIYLQYNNESIGEGITSKVYVGNSFNEGEELTLYSYKDGNVVADGKVKVEEGYISLVPKGNKYFLTKADLSSAPAGETKTKGKVNPFMIIAGVELVIIIGLVLSKVIKPKNKETKVEPANVIPIVDSTPSVEATPVSAVPSQEGPAVEVTPSQEGTTVDLTNSQK